MKLFMRVQIGENNPDVEVLELLFDLDSNGNPLFAVHMSEDEWGTIEFAQGLYDFVAEKYSDVINDDKEVVIDLNWALGIVKSLKD